MKRAAGEINRGDDHYERCDNEAHRNVDAYVVSINTVLCIFYQQIAV